MKEFLKNPSNASRIVLRSMKIWKKKLKYCQMRRKILNRPRKSVKEFLKNIMNVKEPFLFQVALNPLKYPSRFLLK